MRPSRNRVSRNRDASYEVEEWDLGLLRKWLRGRFKTCQAPLALWEPPGQLGLPIGRSEVRLCHAGCQ
jgi:hypothetical protein